MQKETLPMARHRALTKAVTSLVGSCALCLAPIATAQAPLDPQLRVQSQSSPGEPMMLEAETLATYRAPEADQGVAIDGEHFYAIDNSVIAKYSLTDGRQIKRWEDPAPQQIEHLNSCYAREGLLWCANSNYPAAPMGSSIEIFDAKTMEHHRSHSLGMMEEGSLTWFSHYEDGYLAAFAHYDERGVPYKDHSYASIVVFDDKWRRTGGWLLPPALIALLAPHASSGGAIGPDGKLYVTGHDRPEMYVLELPTRGPYLIHLATIRLEIAGQAFSFVPGESAEIFAIDRADGLVRHIRLPRVSQLPVALSKGWRPGDRIASQSR